MRRIGTWLALLVAVAIAATAAPSAAAPTVTISFWHGMSGPLGGTTAKLIDEFNRLNPGITVLNQYQGSYGALNQKLVAAIAAGAPPTVTQVFSNWTDQFIEAKAIVPVERFIQGPDGLSDDEVNDILPILRRGNTYDGVLWTMPFNKSLWILFYNATLLRQNRLAVPETWEDLLKVSQALTQTEGGRVTRYGFVLRPFIDYFAAFYLTTGAEWLTRDGARVAFNGTEGVRALQFMVDLANKYKVAYVIPGFADQDFAAGKVAMYIATNPGVVFSQQAIGGKFELGLAELPRDRVTATSISGTDLAIMARATPEQQAAGWKLIKFLTSAAVTTRWHQETYYAPVRRSALNSSLMQQYVRQEPIRKVLLDALASAKVDPPIKEWFDIRDFVSTAVETALLAKATPKQALDEAAARSNAVLAKRGK